VLALMLALSADDRVLRFCTQASDDTITNYAGKLDFDESRVYGAFDVFAQLAGVAEIVRNPQSAKVELAFAVHPDYRGQGIGTLLMGKAIAKSEVMGAEKAEIMYLAQNMPMRRMAGHAGMKSHTEYNEVIAFKELQMPVGAEHAEAMDDMASQAAYVGVVTAKFYRESCETFSHAVLATFSSFIGRIAVGNEIPKAS